MSEFSNRIGAPVQVTALPLERGLSVELCCARLLQLDGAITALVAGSAAPLFANGVEALRLVEGIKALLLDVLVDGSEAHETEVRDVVGRLSKLLDATDAQLKSATDEHQRHQMLALASATQGKAGA